MGEVGEHVGEVPLDHAGGALHRRDAGAPHPTPPVGEEGAPLGRIIERPEVAEGLLIAHARAVLRRAPLSLANSARRCSGTLASWNSHRCLVPTSRVSPSAASLCGSRCFAVWKRSKTILPSASGTTRTRRLDEGLPHVHGDGFHALHGHGSERLIAGGETLLAAVLHYLEHAPAVDVDEDRAVLVSLGDRLLVHAETTRWRIVSASKVACDGALPDVVASSQLSLSKRAAFARSILSTKEEAPSARALEQDRHELSGRRERPAHQLLRALTAAPDLPHGVRG